MAVWSEVGFQNVVPSTRFDAEYYQPHFLHYATLTQGGDKLETQAAVSHPTEVVRIYKEEGIQILLAQNVRANRLDFSHMAFMATDMAHDLRRNLLQLNDVVMTRSGANYGDTAVYKGSPTPLYACADVLILRSKKILGGYLSTFFNTKIGRALLDRGAYGAAQPHIAPNYLNNLRIPRFPNYEGAVNAIVEQAYAAEARSLELYAEAETLLLDALGLNDLEATHAITYERNFQEVARAGRFDAEYFHTRYIGVIEAVRERTHAPLRRHATIHSGHAWKSAYFLENSEPGEPFVRIRNCRPGTIDNAELSRLDSEYALSERATKAEAGDLVVGMDGVDYFNAALLRESCFVNQRVCRVSLHEDAPFSSEYVMLFLNSRVGQSQLLREMTIAQTVGHITNENVRDLLIPLLSDELRTELSRKVKESITARDDSQSLLENAKRRVEELIEGG